MISDDDFRLTIFNASGDATDDVCYIFHVPDLRYQNNFIVLHPIKVELNFDGVVSIDISRYDLALTKNLVSISSDGQRHFDIF